MKNKFFITDVFGNNKYSGNQLATFIECKHFSDEEMQQIASELGFSETTYILSNKIRNGGYDVRIFTPKLEVDFAGHPTLGTAYIINNYIQKKKSNTVKLNLKAGQIPVEFSTELLWMTQNPPEFGKQLKINSLSEILSIDNFLIDDNFPIEEVSTGLPFTIVPLKSLEALKKAQININLYNEFCKKTKAKGILIFAPKGYEEGQSLSVRMFAHYVGVPEDPATGSANGCLAGYLVKNKYFNSSSINIKVGQGYEIERPSELSLVANEFKDRIEIKVGGKVIPIAEGFWF